MPAEWAPHERTLMAWPCRRELWGAEIARAKEQYAEVANAVAAFEPVTMVCADEAAAAEARPALAAPVEILVLGLDDSWLRDSGPIFTLDPGTGERVGVHFRFNAWGGKFAPWDRDEAAGGELARRHGDRVVEADMVLEGGAIAVDGAGLLLTTEECLLHPSRNPSLSREEIEERLRAHLGAERIIWLGKGLAGDRDTDGHVDLVAAFTAPGRVLLQSAPAGTEDHERCAENRERAQAAGLDVVDFPLLPHAEVAGERIVAAYLNFYVCNRAVIVPLAGARSDDEALERIGMAYPGREVVGVPATTIAYGGGGPHCITQQVPARA